MSTIAIVPTEKGDFMSNKRKLAACSDLRLAAALWLRISGFALFCFGCLGLAGFAIYVLCLVLVTNMVFTITDPTLNQMATWSIAGLLVGVYGMIMYSTAGLLVGIGIRRIDVLQRRIRAVQRKRRKLRELYSPGFPM